MSKSLNHVMQGFYSRHNYIVSDNDQDPLYSAHTTAEQAVQAVGQRGVLLTAANEKFVVQDGRVASAESFDARTDARFGWSGKPVI